MVATARRIEGAALRRLRRGTEARVPAALRSRWRDPTPVGSPRATRIWTDRLHRDRTEIVPWVDEVIPLDGARVLEVGGGRGASTLALAEQGAHVTVLDPSAPALRVSTRSLASSGLPVDRVRGSAASPPFAPRTRFDAVVFWASFEHMTLEERRSAWRAAGSVLGPDGLVFLIEAPNRLWPLDSHTSDLPFFQWLPDDLATRYRSQALRRTVAGLEDGDVAGLARLGRGVSYHDLADRSGRRPEVVSCMQLCRRRRDPRRGVGWAVSRAGRTERLLRSYAPEVERAWFQPFHYLALRHPTPSAGGDPGQAGA